MANESDFLARALMSLGGNPPGQVEDRRNEYNPYAHMLAGNQNIRELMRIILAGKQPYSGLPAAPAVPVPQGQLPVDAGYYDIK